MIHLGERPLLGSNEVNTLLDLSLEVVEHLSDLLLLVVVRVKSSGVDLGDTVLAQVNFSSEESSAESLVVLGGLDESELLGDGLASVASEDSLGELGTSSSHGQGSRTTTSLGLDDLITTEHDAGSEVVKLLTLDRHGSGSEGEERHDGSTSVTTDDRNGDGLASLLRSEGVSTELVKGGNTEELLGVVDAELLQCLSPDGDSGVDWVRDNEIAGVGALLCALTCNGVVDVGVDVEEVVTSHAGLARNTSGDDDDISILESSTDVLGTRETLNLDVGGDVREVASNTGGDGSDVVEGEGGHKTGGVELEEEGERLADTTCSTNNADAVVTSLLSGCDDEARLLNGRN